MFKHTSNLDIYKQNLSTHSPAENGELGVIRTFTYSSNGDNNDVGYWLGTRGNSINWQNPSKPIDTILPDVSTIGPVSMSASSATTDRLAHSIWARSVSANIFFFWTLSISTAAVFIVFNYGRKFKLKRYTTQCSSTTYNFSTNQRNWDISASNDGINWTILHNGQNQTSTTLSLWYASPVLSNETYYQYYKIDNVDGSNATQRGIFSHYFYGDLFCPLGLTY